MYLTIPQLMKSRTFWMAFLAVAANALQAYSPMLPPKVLEGATIGLSLATMYFRANPVQGVTPSPPQQDHHSYYDYETKIAANLRHNDSALPPQ